MGKEVVLPIKKKYPPMKYKGVEFPVHLLSRGAPAPINWSSFKFQAIQWSGVDEGRWLRAGQTQKDGRQYTVYVNGVAEDGRSVTLKTAYNPFFTIRVPDDTNVKAFVRKHLIEGDKLMTYADKQKRELEYETRDVYYPRTLTKRLFGGKTCELIVKDSLVKYKEIWMRDDIRQNFTGPVPKQCKFIYLEFNTLDMLRLCVDYLRKEKADLCDIYEANLEPHLRFAHQTKVQAAGWISITDPSKMRVFYSKQKNEKHLRATRTDIELHVLDWRAILGLDEPSVAPIRLLSFDLECRSSVATQFPNPNNDGDGIIQASMCFSDLGRANSSVSILINVGPCAKLDPGQILIQVKTERELLMWVMRLIKKCDPDIVHAYNAYGFDLEYLAVRAQKCNIEKKFYAGLSKLRSRRGRLYRKKLKSNAYGANYWNIVTMPGRFVLDTMVYMKKEFKLASYSLNYVAKNFLSSNLGPNPLSTEPGSDEITVTHKNHGFNVGDVVNLSNVTTPILERRDGHSFYTCAGWTFEQLHGCMHVIKEVVDENTYVIRMSTPNNLSQEEQKTWSVGGSNISVFESKLDVSFVEMNEAYNRGDGDVIAEVGKYCIQDALLPQRILDRLCIIFNMIEMAKVTWTPMEYLVTRGQQVKAFSQICRHCWPRNIAVPAYGKVDPDSTVKKKFKGGAVLNPHVGFHVYPVACLDFAALYPSIIFDNNFDYMSIVTQLRYLNLPNVMYRTFDMDDGTTETFAVTKEMGIIPYLANELLIARSAEKKKMAAAKDPMQRKIHNAAQLAFKVSCNSLYGFTGVPADKALLPCQGIARATTLLGRLATFFSRDYAQDKNNFKDAMECTTHFPSDYVCLARFIPDYKTEADLSPEEIDAIWKKNSDSVWVYGSRGYTRVLKPPSSYGKPVIVAPKSWHSLVTLDKLRANPGSCLIYGSEGYQFITKFSEDDQKRLCPHLTQGRIFDMQNYSCIVRYGDTDSVFTQFDSSHLENPLDRVVYNMMVGQYVAAKITHEIRMANKWKPYNEQRMELEYEKVYIRILFYSKKRYDGWMVELNPHNPYKDSKGNPQKRRDFCPFVKEICGKLTGALFNLDKHDHDELVGDALAIAKRAIEDLFNNRVPIQKLVLSKSLNDEYKMRDKVASKNKRKRTFGPHNIFEKDLIKVKRGRKEWKIIEKGQVDTRTLKGALVIEEQPVTERKDKHGNIVKIRPEDMPKRIMERRTITYDDIRMRCGKMMPLTKIMDPQTPLEELEQATQAHTWVARKKNIRDPASAPSSGNRVSFGFFEVRDKTALQRERAEDIDYALAHNMVPDVFYYEQKQCKKSWALILNTASPGSCDAIFADAEIRYKQRQSGQMSLDSSLNMSMEREIVVTGKRKEVSKTCAKQRYKKPKFEKVTKEGLASFFACNKK